MVTLSEWHLLKYSLHRIGKSDTMGVFPYLDRQHCSYFLKTEKTFKSILRRKDVQSDMESCFFKSQAGYVASSTTLPLSPRLMLEPDSRCLTTLCPVLSFWCSSVCQGLEVYELCFPDPLVSSPEDITYHYTLSTREALTVRWSRGEICFLLPLVVATGGDVGFAWMLLDFAVVSELSWDSRDSGLQGELES